MGKIIAVLGCCVFMVAEIYAQHVSGKFLGDTRPDWPQVPHVSSHDPHFKLTSTSCFYKRKSEWQKIIDSTWGPGLSLASKLQIFDSYSRGLTEKFDGFLFLGISWASWDSIKTAFRSRINDSTSRGAFAAIMSQFAWRLRDGHTWALDNVVTNTPLNPGVPLLDVWPMSTAEHFGAVLTALPDSTALVLRTVQSHPLGLEPGDIVLGYEGIPWKRLVRELMDACLPINTGGVGAASAEMHALIRNVGNNWHLFDTIDVIRNSKGDTVHLSVQPLLGLPPDPMMGNEQLAIPGIASAQWFLSAPSNPVFYGVIPGTSIGYIQMFAEYPPDLANGHLYEAINTLWKTRGLIIDLRWNAGYWAAHEFDRFFARMFSQRIWPIEDVYRANTTSFDLVTVDTRFFYEIAGSPGSLYDRPIAVLLGPACVSGGDIMAWLLHFHPMARTFGKPTFASLGDNQAISFADWYLNFSISAPFLTSQPGLYLNRSEFPVDEPVWFTANEVAQGVDPVLTRALQWITTLSHAHDVQLVHPSRDTLQITARVQNPLAHTLKVTASLTDGATTLADSLALKDDGLHGDGAAGDSLWGYMYVPPGDASIHATIRTDDLTAGTSRTLPDAASIEFTRKALIVMDTRTIDLGRISVATSQVDTTFVVRNIGYTADSLTVSVDPENVTPDTAVAAFPKTFRLAPGDSQKVTFRIRLDLLSTGVYYAPQVMVQSKSAFGQTLFLKNYQFQVVISSISDIAGLPTVFALSQNYPNPFNPSTTIRYGLPHKSQVSLMVYDPLGQLVSKLVSAEQEAGYHEVKFDGSGCSSGVYFYRLQAGTYAETKKLLLVR